MSSDREGQEERWSSWMAAAQKGDTTSYERLLEDVLPVLRVYIRKRLGGSAAVEDVVQNTLLSVHRARHTFRPERPFGPWLRTIARNALVDWIRKDARTRGREQVLHEEFHPSTSAPQDEKEGQTISPETQAALEKLTPGQRQAVELLQIEDMSVVEAAARVGISPSALKVRAHRGYKALRSLLGEDSS